MATNEHELQSFARNYMTAYNQQNLDALRTMYSEYVTRIDQDGKEMTGVNQVIDYLSEQFRLNNATLLLHQRSIHWSDAEHAWVAKGTYEIYGTTNIYNIAVHTTGAYSNIMIKDKDRWKIAKTTLTPLVKTLIHHQVEEEDKWMSAFHAALPLRSGAGEVSAEYGVIEGSPNTVYVLSTWPSVAAFQSFMADPDLKEAMQQAGVVGQPTVLILDQE